MSFRLSVTCLGHCSGSACSRGSVASVLGAVPRARQHFLALGRCKSLLARSSRRRRNEDNDSVIRSGLVVAALGRVNVGKSTLFNRLARAGIYLRDSENRRVPFVPSIVDQLPGITRDSREATASVMDLEFKLIDTAGLEDPPGREASSASTLLRDKQKSGSEPLKRLTHVPSLLNTSALNPDSHYRNLYDSMSRATAEAVKCADALLFVIDASAGPTPLDHAIAVWIRENASMKDLFLLANKCDTANARAGCYEALQLGFGEPIAISAEHNIGFGDLYWALKALHDKNKRKRQEEPEVCRIPGTSSSVERADIACRGKSTEPVSTDEDGNSASAGTSGDVGVAQSLSECDAVDREPDKYANASSELNTDSGEMGSSENVTDSEGSSQLIVSILGRPNVGKSTLLNKLLKSDHSLVGPVSGVTRDAILGEWRPSASDQERVWIVDTAGIRPGSNLRKMRVESMSVKSSLRALRLSHVTLLVLDANDGITTQDMKIANVAILEGRAVVVVVNKMDCIEKKQRKEFMSNLGNRVSHSLNRIEGVEVVAMTAGLWESDPTQEARLHGAILRAHDRWNRRVPTSALVRFVRRFNDMSSVGMSKVKSSARHVIKFIVQQKTRPPVFKLHGPADVSDQHVASLIKEMRREFGFEGVPIRIKRPRRQRM